jgi:hypothetical protein
MIRAMHVQLLVVLKAILAEERHFLPMSAQDSLETDRVLARKLKKARTGDRIPIVRETKELQHVADDVLSRTNRVMGVMRDTVDALFSHNMMLKEQLKQLQALCHEQKGVIAHQRSALQVKHSDHEDAQEKLDKAEMKTEFMTKVAASSGCVVRSLASTLFFLAGLPVQQGRAQEAQQTNPAPVPASLRVANASAIWFFREALENVAPSPRAPGKAAESRPARRLTAARRRETAGETTTRPAVTRARATALLVGHAQRPAAEGGPGGRSEAAAPAAGLSATGEERRAACEQRARNSASAAVAPQNGHKPCCAASIYDGFEQVRGRASHPPPQQGDWQKQKTLTPLFLGRGSRCGGRRGLSFSTIRLFLTNPESLLCAHLAEGKA